MHRQAWVLFISIILLVVVAVGADERQDRINALKQQSLYTATEPIQEGFVDDDDDVDFSHQLVVFAVGGLTSNSFSPRWMPYSSSAVSVSTSHGRTIGRPRYESLGWMSYFYGATPEEYGCHSDDDCTLPSEFTSHRSLLDVLQYDYGYGVQVFSENARVMGDALRGHYSVRPFLPDTLDMLEHASHEMELPQTPRRVLVFHFDGADRVGHAMGFDRENYHAQVQCIDWQIQRIVQSTLAFNPEHTTFTLISDHGGSGYGHRAFTLDVLQVPIAWWGYGACLDEHLDDVGVDSVQWAPTVFGMIGLDVPPEWNHPSLEERAACDEDEDDAPLHGEWYWNATYDGVCPVHIGYRHRYAYAADETRIVSTLAVFVAIFWLGWWLIQVSKLRD